MLIYNILKEYLTDDTVFFIDYDGTLVNLSNDPEKTFLDENGKKLLFLLDKKYKLYIVSGRTIEDLNKFIDLDLNYIGLHGAVLKMKGKEPEYLIDKNEYAKIAEEIIEKSKFINDPCLRIYNKGLAVVFHFGNCKENSITEIKKFIDNLIVNYEDRMEVYNGINLYEIRPRGINKGLTIKRLLNKEKCVIAGDEKTDEDAFIQCNNCLTIKVGSGHTSAMLRVSTPEEFKKILWELVS
ncbi:trehalose-phosphatase [Caldiplasma sukawensis]